MSAQRRDDAKQIWQAALAASDPFATTRDAILEHFADGFPPLIVVGGGKAAARMAAGLESAYEGKLDRLSGVLSIPGGAQSSCRKIELIEGRPAGSNHPTAAGVGATHRMIELLRTAEPDANAVCLVSGGGSALMPAPVGKVGLEAKQQITKLLHDCGATITEMNTVRKHLSIAKGGGFARAFAGESLLTLVISDVIGNVLDVIASGITSADSSMFTDALAILDRYDLRASSPPAVLEYLLRGAAGLEPETLKETPETVTHQIIGSNSLARNAAREKAESLGYTVLDCGSWIEGETAGVAQFVSGMVRSIFSEGVPVRPPCCLLLGGETTVTFRTPPGLGGRNQEFVLAMLTQLPPSVLSRCLIVSLGTDGEDGPTDAAGAFASLVQLEAAKRRFLDPRDFLARHDSYQFFDATGGLIRTGLTGTNVMDVRFVLIGQ